MAGDYGVLTPSEMSQLPGEQRFVIQTSSSLQHGEIPIRLKAAAGVDTVIYLPLRPNQRVRPLDFVSLEHRTLGKWGCLGGGTTAITLDSANEPLNACSLAHAVLLFNRDSSSATDAHGPQYLNIVATLRSASEELITSDSIKWVVSPPGYELQPGYETGATLPLSRLVDGLGRYSRPGSNLTVSVQHDPARYKSGAGLSNTVYLRDARRFSVAGVAGITPLTGFIAKKRSTTVTREPIFNGTTADTLISLERSTEWISNVATIGFFAALDFRSYFGDGRETPAKLRLAAYYMNSPYENANKPAIAVMYPLEVRALTGALEFSLSPGWAATPGERPFFLLSTNIGLTSGKN